MGFTISTEVLGHLYKNKKTYPSQLKERVHEALKKIETTMGKNFGSETDPLLVSVCSGARASIPTRYRRKTNQKLV
jgi:pyruvate,orthophosphate dikinase